MSVKVVFEFTHTEDGIDVKHEVVDGGKGGCVCEVAIATVAINEVRSGVAAVSQVVKDDPAFYGHARTGGVH
ncbi:hypothetical protein JZN10_000870 [Salmonella enterica]|nr:hypothetical protein [Salmonella enterica subsp. enterica serovar Infantis]ECS8429334.1 hypothetical protein [Salmonella enterica]EDW0933125.1 hypothetical protein [Salmonella enterica subsp. enterica serovar Gaminara]EFO7852277.1 hypothetical protein [Salmonella enterica]EHB1586941.1 hypothetical protein [Salmonella enterica]